MLKTVCYLSTPKKDLTVLEYEGLFRQTKNNNDKLGVFGALVTTKAVFFQIIEGKYDVINTLYAKIKRDTRHYNIIEMLNQSIDEFNFNEFGVGYSVINDEDSLRLLYKYINHLESNKKNNILFSNIILNLLNVGV